MLHLVLIYGWQAFRKGSFIDGFEQVRSYAKVYVLIPEEIEVQKSLKMWVALEEHPPIQKLHANILYDLRAYFGKEKLFNMAKRFLGNH